MLEWCKDAFYESYINDKWKCKLNEPYTWKPDIYLNSISIHKNQKKVVLIIYFYMIKIHGMYIK